MADILNREGRNRCGYCAAPLPAEALSTPQNSSLFCCYGCRILGEHPAHFQDPNRVVTLDGSGSSPWFRIGLGAVIASQTMVYGFALNLSQPDGSIRLLLHGALMASALAVGAILGWPLARASWDCACRRTVGVEYLFLSGVLGAFAASVWSSITEIGAVYYEVVAVLLTVYTAGKSLTATARRKALAETDRLRQTFASARREDGRQVPVTEIIAGDCLLVRPGEPISVDGKVLSGTAFVRESPLTGEPGPVVKRLGDTVLAGSFSEDGELRIEALIDGRSRRIDRLLDQMESARGSLLATQAQGEADRLAAWFLPIVLLTSIGTFIFWGLQGNWRPGLFHSLSVLLVACPCALGLATPLGLWQALATLAAHGVVVREAATVERLAEINRVVFDKTGTLTESAMSLLDFVAVDPERRQELFAGVVAIEARSRHPIARAFQNYQRDDVPLPAVHDFRVTPGCGIEAELSGVGAEGIRQSWRVGTIDWICGSVEKAEKIRCELLCQAIPCSTEIWVSVGGAPVAMARVREQIRDSVKDLIDPLRHLGLSIQILSGDRPDRVGTTVDALDRTIPWEGTLTPEGKASRIRVLQEGDGRVLFVGDGLNDGPALREAYVGMALAEGDALTREAADAIICGNDLRRVVFVLTLARQVRNSIRSNLLFATVYNGLGMLLAATGHLHPVAAALLMAGSSAVVGWRAWRHSDCLPSIAIQSPRFPWMLTATLALQVPMLTLLGNLPLQQVATLTLGFSCLIWASIVWRRRLKFSLDGAGSTFIEMTFSMLGPSSLGMLIGWWVEVDFGPVMREGHCLCCGGMGLTEGGWKVPWMALGMIAAGLPGMWLGLSRWGSFFGRWPALGLVAAGMVLGMNWGAIKVLEWMGPRHPWQFTGAFLGMICGMLLGMGFSCALAEAGKSMPLNRTTKIVGKQTS